MAHEWSFHTKPFRHYRCDGEAETPNGLKIASVTQALGVLDKPALPQWAANVTAQAFWTLATTKGYRIPRDVVKGGVVTWPGWRRMQKDVKDRGLDHDSTRDEAAFRGTTVHKIFEDWVESGAIPNPVDYPEHWRGYIAAVVRWIMDMSKAGAKFEVAEVIVGSATHGFAGTCDTVAVTVVDGKRVRWDLKTSKQTYARSHFRQIAAYELAHVEMGGVPTDRLAIIILRADGTYKASFSDEVEWFTTPEDAFLTALMAWRDDQPLKKHEDAEYKARCAHEKGATA